MEWKVLSKSKSAEEFFDLILHGSPAPKCHESYITLKKELEDAFSYAIGECSNPNGAIVDKYKFDCYFGLKLYEILSQEKYSFKEHDASNDGIWRYIQIYVIPDIIKSRVGCNDDAFYKKPNRLYLKRIWWYIHLSMHQNSLENAKNIILNPCNNTDTILQMVDRSGKHGYRIKLYRMIMYYKSQKNMGGDLFRELLKLNNARIKVIDPYLVNGGIESYVNKLYGDIL